MRPLILDLFSGAGGAACGYHRAGFDVVGVDIVNQPRYPFPFQEGDAIELMRTLLNGGRFRPSDGRHVYLEDFAAIHASPPCQAYSAMRVMANARDDHQELLEPTRELLRLTGLPWVVENVEQAPMDVGETPLFGPENGVRLCGSMFGLMTCEFELRRHRLFESNQRLVQPRCNHTGREVIGFYGDHARRRTRINGHHARGTDISRNDEKMALVRDLMGIDWMTWDEAKLAIPPAFTEYIGKRLLEAHQ